MRHFSQLAFLVLILVGTFFFLAHCEVWCPFGGVESIYAYFAEGSAPCSLGVSNFFILGGVLGATLLFRRVFCSFACPIGTLSEWTGKLGKRLRLPQWNPGPKTDAVLGLLKYVVLVTIIYLTILTAEVIFRAACPAYALISRHGEDITFWSYTVGGSILVASLFISLPFCRWFCPLASVLNPFSRFAPVRVTHDPEGTCTSCKACEKVCPMAIPVATSPRVTQARCLNCTQCVDACEKRGQKMLRVQFLGLNFSSKAKLSQCLLLLGLLTALGTAVVLATFNPLPSTVIVRTETKKVNGKDVEVPIPPPEKVAVLEVDLEGLVCRGTAQKVWGFFLTRDDDYAIDGYLRFEAWSHPTLGRGKFYYDPKKTNADAIKQALTQPYFNATEEVITMDVIESPVTIPGYDPILDAPFPDDLDLGDLDGL